MRNTPKVVLQIETSRAYGRGLLHGIAKYARMHGPWIFYREHSGLEKSLPKLKDWGVTGIILRDASNIEKIVSGNIPAIFAIHMEDKDKMPHMLHTVITDDDAIGTLAAEHLLDRGFQNFGYCGFDETQWSRARGNAFGRRIARNKFETHIYTSLTKKHSWSEELASVAAWLISLPKPVGIMACNDDRAQHILEAAKIINVKIPEEAAVVGVDNDELLCELSDPPLSSIALNTEKGGYEAAAILDKLMAGKHIKGRIISIEPVKVVVRRSTDILAVNDDEVAAAVEYIRNHAREKILIKNVVNATTTSRRNLQKQFRRILGRSILDEIKRVHAEHIAYMLTETNFSLSYIAESLGYNNMYNLSRFFREAKGINALTYRKRFGKI